MPIAKTINTGNKTTGVNSIKPPIANGKGPVAGVKNGIKAAGKGENMMKDRKN